MIIEEWDETFYRYFKYPLLNVEDVRELLYEDTKKTVTAKSIAKALKNIGWEKLKKRGQKKINKKTEKTPYLYSKESEKYNKLSDVKLWTAWEDINIMILKNR